jgi:hypothetical protein
MKSKEWKTTIMAILLVILAVLCGSCPAPGDNLPDYYIMFDLDGQRQLYTNGFTDMDLVPFAVQSGGTWTEVYATLDSGKTISNYNNHVCKCIHVVFEDNWYLTGTWGFAHTGLDFCDGATPFNRIGTDETVTVTANVTKAGDPGTVVGTFSGTVALGVSHAISNGKFRCKRIYP